MNLHNEIMNLACKVPYKNDQFFLIMAFTYKEGHRDARHAAAELVLAADNKIEQLEHEIVNLSRQLAAERLRADLAEQRYENANLGQKLAREELARLNAKISSKEVAEKPTNYVEIASARGYTVEFLPNGKPYYMGKDLLPSRWFNTRAEAFKAACEDNGLLGEK